MALPDFDLIEGKYQVLDKLREGGMGAVYRVRHRLLDEIRVIKVIRPQLEADDKLRERFLREARSAVQLRHPNIALLHDFSIDDEGVAFMVMECIEGEDLKRVLTRYPRLPVSLGMEVGLQILRALKYLHASSFVHRDISPDNIMLTRDVEGRVLVKLIDLGVAKSLEGTGEDLTRAGIFVGKYRYGAPEQFGGSGLTVDSRTDLYSLGVVLYEILTGEPPFAGESEREIVGGHLFHPPRDFAETDPDGRLPEALREIVLKALEKTPEDRFQDADEFGLALRAVQDSYVPPDDEPAIELATKAVSVDAQAVDGTTQWRLDNNFAPEATPPPLAEVGIAEPGSGAAGRAPAPRSRRPLAWAGAAAVLAVIALLGYLALRDDPREVAASGAAEPPSPERATESTPPESESEPEPEAITAGPQPDELDETAVPVVQLPTREAEPPPRAVPPAPPPGPDPRVATLIREAQALFRDGRDEATLERIDEALALDPGNGAAQRLLRDLSSSAESKAVRARRNAEAAQAESLASAGFERGRSAERAGSAHLTGGRHRQAISSFLSSAEQYAQAVRTAEEARRTARLAAEQAERQRREEAERQAEPEREPAPAPAVDQRPAILRLLNNFAGAHQALDIAAVRALWPSLSGSRLRALEASFEGAREMEMRLSGCVVQLGVAAATARCLLEQTYRPKRGTRQSVERQVTFELVAKDGDWLIEDY